MIVTIIASFTLGLYIADLYNRKIIDQYKITINSWKMAFESAMELYRTERKLNGKTEEDS